MMSNRKECVRTQGHGKERNLPVKNVLLTIAYDGTNFSGWQRQPGRRTVQGEVERVLSILCKQEISVNGTSRTDAGVHALDQHCSFCGEFGIPVERIVVAANHLFLAGSHGPGSVSDVRILEAKEVPMDFHARFNSRGKRYLYKIRNAAEPDMFQRNQCYQIERPLDHEAMHRAGQHIVGEHDFRCFMASGSQVGEDTVRTVYDLSVTREGDWITLSISGNGFLYNMVRIITGTLVEVGLGQRTEESVAETIRSGQRAQAGHTAPPQGLYLAKVFYDDITINERK